MSSPTLQKNRDMCLTISHIFCGLCGGTEGFKKYFNYAEDRSDILYIVWYTLHLKTLYLSPTKFRKHSGQYILALPRETRLSIKTFLRYLLNRVVG